MDCFFICLQAQLTRIGLNLAPGVEPQTVVFAAVYDIKANTTTVPDRRDAMPMSVTDPVYLITTMLKRFADYNPNMSKFIVMFFVFCNLKNIYSTLNITKIL